MEEDGEERRIAADSSSPNFLSQFLMSNPLLLCLRFPKELGGRIMFITSRSEEKYSLLIK